MNAAWQPVLDAAARAPALETVYSIAEDLAKQAVDGPLLARGKAGVAILYAYLALARADHGDEQTAVRLLNQAVDAVAAMKMAPCFFTGFAGIAWANAHLEGRVLHSIDEDANDEIDLVLQTHLRQSPWRGDYNLLTGLVGFGVYALERMPREAAINCLESIIDRLGETAERTAVGITWFTPPDEHGGHGHYNLGLAPGVPGVIAFLAQVCAPGDERLGRARTKTRPLLDGAVAWLLAQQSADGTQGFPSKMGPGISPTPARIAWCYGDLGIAVALLRAARDVQKPAWEEKALMIADRAANRRPEIAGVKDCGLCHGAAGVAHLFNRLFQATGDSGYAAAARFWFARTLEMRRPGSGIAGFSALFPEAGVERWVLEPGLLRGAAGIGLALLAAATPIEPSWDRMLLVSSSFRRTSF